MFPYKEFEFEQKSKFKGNYYGEDNGEPRQEPGESEKFYFGDHDFLTQEITIVFSKIRDFDYYTYCRDVAVQAFDFFGMKAQFVPDTKEFER